jgi:chemotaxis protein methyltransferase CheR
LSRIRANQGRLAEALQLVEQALRTDKLNPGLHYLRAMILQEQGRIDEAVASLKRALYLDQDLVLAHFTLGNVAQRQGKDRESRKHFGHALAALARYHPEEVLAESEGMPAGRLTKIIRARLPA